MQYRKKSWGVCFAFVSKKNVRFPNSISVASRVFVHQPVRQNDKTFALVRAFTSERNLSRSIEWIYTSSLHDFARYIDQESNPRNSSDTMWHTRTCLAFRRNARKKWSVHPRWPDLHWPCREHQTRGTARTGNPRSRKMHSEDNFTRRTLRPSELPSFARGNKRVNDTVCRTKSSGCTTLSFLSLSLFTCGALLPLRFTSDWRWSWIYMYAFCHFRCTFNCPPPREGDPLLSK